MALALNWYGTVSATIERAPRKKVMYIGKTKTMPTIYTFSVIEFAKQNNIKLIYSATSSNLGNKGKDESLSPYAWSKTKNIELIISTREVP